MNKWTEINFLASCTLIWEGLRVLERKEGTFFAIWRRRKKVEKIIVVCLLLVFPLLRFLNESSIAFAAICVACIIDGLEAFFSLLSLCRHHSGWPEQSFPDVLRRLRCQQPCPKLRCLRQCDRKSPWIGCSCWPK